MFDALFAFLAALFCASPNFRAAKKQKMPRTCGKPYGNACYAGYIAKISDNSQSSHTYAEGVSNNGMQLIFALFLFRGSCPATDNDPLFDL